MSSACACKVARTHAQANRRARPLLLVASTENPWEANMFYIPAATFAYSENLGDTLTHSRRVVDYVRTTWPFFNRYGRAHNYKQQHCAPPAGAKQCMRAHQQVSRPAAPSGRRHHRVGPRAWTTFCG